MERTKTQTRRRLLTVAGGSLVAIAGCLGSGEDDDTETEAENETETEDEDETDETESESTDDDEDENEEEEEEEENDTEEAASTLEHEGTEVPLVSMDDAIEWYEADDAHFVDTRGRPSYEDRRIDGAVLSPAPDGMSSDPVDDWDHDETIVTYCACPHSIAVRRSASLIEDGYENVFVLEGGLDAWAEEGQPMEGEAVDD
ncbi:rhodanese-like domain-containing protein [Natronoglomus mannanivorans]|uniref:Rhodanese-like domain-containing protein n=1 Tax=Natronoglomus mannanivorans TaxID=2979990 RepID=A0AAP2Z3L0_9EURY|nr:rhodanese-like domain-containing protein [Halobacteria archaeon AArc-xg1-1]